MATGDTLHGHATHERRMLRISGSDGELRGVLHEGGIEVTRHGSMDVERHQLDGSPIGRFGGDEGLLRHFCGALAGGAADEGGTSGRVSLESHLIGFAAERAQLGSEVVEMAGFRQAVRSAAAS